MKNLFLLLRPHQWLKNLFVLAGVVFAHAWLNVFLMKQVALAFVAFCFVSSAIYIFNDIIDRPNDCLHPIKKNRPLAAGTVSLVSAISLACVMGVLGLLLGLTVSITVAVILISYIVLNIAYSLFLKQQIVVDVFVIALGFLLRILAGTIGIDIPLTGWLLFCGFVLTLFLGFCKRSAEIKFNVQHYSETLLNKFITITATSSVVGYTLYALQQDSLLPLNKHQFIYTVPLVMFGIFRYLYLLETQPHHGIDIARDLLRDKQMLITVITWLLAMIMMRLQ